MSELGLCSPGLSLWAGLEQGTFPPGGEVLQVGSKRHRQGWRAVGWGVRVTGRAGKCRSGVGGGGLSPKRLRTTVLGGTLALPPPMQGRAWFLLPSNPALGCNLTLFEGQWPGISPWWGTWWGIQGGSGSSGGVNPLHAPWGVTPYPPPHPHPPRCSAGDPQV